MGSTSAIPMEIATVCQTYPTGSGTERYVVVLDEEEGDRRLPIWVGEHEGIALACALEGLPLPRPMTHVATGAPLRPSDSHITGVSISALCEGTYHAVIVLDSPSGQSEVDARPSDALILAVLSGAPVTVDVTVLEQPWSCTEASCRALTTSSAKPWLTPRK